MGLVDYSESESSGDEHSSFTVQPKATSDATSASKASFHKVVDKSNPRKIKVSLPEAASASGSNTVGVDVGSEGPPAKKARTAGAFGGFNSFLPAPKNAAGASGSLSTADGAAKSRSVGLGRGISLKTGAQPAFSRAPPPAEESYEDSNNDGDEAAEAEHAHTDEASIKDVLPDVIEEDKPAKKTAMFRPLSVARKPDKKKKKPLTTNGVTSSDSTSSRSAPVVKDVPVVFPPKRSLFASSEAEPELESAGASTTQYQPYFEDQAAQRQDADTGQVTEQQQSSSKPASQAPSLGTLANTLNLSGAEKRQLFGRSGAPSEAQLASFSVAQEYQHNREMAASADANAAAAPQTVRSIAPGKHSLQQLLNQATSQKDALEESYAAGRRNKKEVGSRYGW